MLDVIKSYLVGLGFQVNQSEFQQAQKAINDLGGVVQKATSGMTKNFATAATGVAAALTTINTATAGLVAQVAKADMQYQKFALRLWTTKETAKALKTTLDAMGEDMTDVAWIPELRREFMQLRRQGSLMQTPGDAGGQLQYVRSVMFEFKRMKLEVQYASEWIAYYLVKYLGGPLANIRKQLSEFNDRITLAMPEWTKKAAKVLTMLMNAGISVVRFVRDLYTGFMRFFDLFPPGARKVVTAIAIIGAAFKLSPFGAAITALILLIEDFYGYIDGRKSSKTLAPLWKGLLDFSKTLRETMVRKSVHEDFVQLLNELSKALDSVGKGISHINRELFGNVSSKSVWQNISDGITSVIKDMIKLGKVIAGVVDMLGLLLQGDIRGAARKGQSVLRDFANFFVNPGDPSGNGHGTSRSWGDAEFESFVNAISGQESGGDYSARNSRTGAYGRFQIMPDNWPSWSAEAGLSAGSPMTPENQDLVARFKLRQYYNKYGARGAATAWYAGEGALNYSDAALKRRQGRGDEPSINEYANSIIGRMARGINPVSFGNMSNALSTMHNYRSAGAGASYAGAAGATIINVGDIYITQPNANPSQIQQAVISGVQKAQSRTTSIQVRELNTVVI